MDQWDGELDLAEAKRSILKNKQMCDFVYFFNKMSNLM